MNVGKVKYGERYSKEKVHKDKDSRTRRKKIHVEEYLSIIHKKNVNWSETWMNQSLREVKDLYDSDNDNFICQS